MSAPACTEANPCGGQSCIVARRQHGDFVHEDFVFRRRGLPLRATCSPPPTPEQHVAFEAAMYGYVSVVVGAGGSGCGTGSSGSSAGRKMDGEVVESDNEVVYESNGEADDGGGV